MAALARGIAGIVLALRHVGGVARFELCRRAPLLSLTPVVAWFVAGVLDETDLVPRSVVASYLKYAYGRRAYFSALGKC